MVFCKYLFFILNFLLFCVGVAVAAIGIWILTDPEFWEIKLNLPIDDFYYATYIVIVVGFILIIIGFIGCCGAIMDNACLLCLFCTVMVFLLILGAAAALVVWLGFHNATVRGFFEDQLSTLLSKQDFFAKLEEYLKCCGVKGREDYKDTIPNSCKDDKGIIYSQGCYAALEAYLKDKAALLGGFSATIAALAVLSLIISIAIMCAARQITKNVV